MPDLHILSACGEFLMFQTVLNALIFFVHLKFIVVATCLVCNPIVASSPGSLGTKL